MNPIPYGRQSITEEDIEAVVQTLKSDYLTQGPKIAEFEKAFADYIGVRYAIAVSNGTAALHLGAIALNVNEKSKVITTPITFAASANCIRYCGGNVAFADIDPETALIDLKQIRKLLETAPRGTYQGIIPVDFAGYPIDMEEVRVLADKFNLWIMEDACHAPGGYFIDSKKHKQFCGNGRYADIAVFSFHPVKHIACGEGGMITTNNKSLYEKLLLLRSHGITKDPKLLHENDGGWYYEMQELGFNYRLTDFQAALGISQLKRAEVNLTRRREIAERYNMAFTGSKVKIMPLNDGIGHAYHLYIIQVENRKGLYEKLRSQNVLTQVHYIPVPNLPYYRQLGFIPGDYPFAKIYYNQCLSLPMFPALTNKEQDYVIELVLKYAN